MNICPFCASECIYFSKKKKTYLCEDCDRCFSQPSLKKGSRIFISYGHDENQELVSLIKKYLTEKGYDVWIDSSNIQKGRDWRERITDGLLASNGVIAFLSKKSVRDPGVCLDELRIALCLKRSYVKSILVENSDIVTPPYRLSDSQWINMENWRSIPKEQWDQYFQNKMAELDAALESDEAKEFEMQLSLISEKLSVYDSIAKEQMLLREDFTGREWLAEKVQNWLENDNYNRIMILGVPGSGKSAFVANFSNFSYDVVARLYLSWDNTDCTDTDKVISLLALKLAVGLNDYRRMLYELLRKGTYRANDSSVQIHGSMLFDFLILNPLSCCIKGDRGRCLVIIDGLDETSEETAHILFKKAALFPEWLRVLFTSRISDGAQSLYSNGRTIILDQNEERNTEDILNYVAHRLDLPIECGDIKALKTRLDGSFIYAKTLCDAILDGKIQLKDLSSLPCGINEFYIDLMERLFPGASDFEKIKPLFELICVEEEICEPIICFAMGIDQYSLWELREPLKSLITCEKGNWVEQAQLYSISTTIYNIDIFEKTTEGFRVFKFIHKSIYDWIQCRETAGRFFIDVRNGYQRLATTCERLHSMGQNALMEVCINNNGYSRIRSLLFRNKVNKSSISERRLQLLIEGFKTLYPCWLVKSRQIEKYQKLLFDQDMDPDKVYKRAVEEQEGLNYCAYYDYYGLWRWADLLPLDEELKDLGERLKEIVTYPNSTMLTYGLRSLQISALLLKELMVTGRFSDVFFTFVKDKIFPSFFKSSFSDDSETRGGWDKYYLTRDIVICLKKLDQLCIPVPEHVREKCEEIKLTYTFRRCEKENGPFSEKIEKDRLDHNYSIYGILQEQELYKDICVYDPVDEEEKKWKMDYNTRSLLYYFVYGDDEDDDYVRKCISHLGDFELASNVAQKSLSLKQTTGKTNIGQDVRLAYVRRMTDNLLCNNKK